MRKAGLVAGPLAQIGIVLAIS